MAHIRLLNDDVIGKIAAGEEVERPAAAIKELIENSLDAGATAVTVEIREGGTDYIRVTDNGCGIDQSDIRMAFERHATSKISKEQDLNAIGTLGFRGEALASIAAVGKVTLITRTKETETGLQVRNEGGRITDIVEKACPTGTSITVKELFFNTPVRRGFMKKPAVEAAAVTELMSHMILSRPDVSFRFISNGKTVYHSAGDGQIESAVYCIYGPKILETLRKVEGHESGLAVRGYVGIGENAKGNRNGQNFFINGRMMRSPLLSAAVENACRERVMIGKFPLCVLYIQVPYDSVDVNVHPNKWEVRFRDEQAVYGALSALVRGALSERDAFEKPSEIKLTPPEEKSPEKDALPPISEKTVQIRPSAVVVTGGSVPAVSRTEKPDCLPVPRMAEVSGTPFVSQETEKPVPADLKPKDVSSPAGKPAKLSSEAQFVAKTAKQTEVRNEETAVPAFDRKDEKAEQVNTILSELQKPLKHIGVLFNTYILVEYEDQLLMIDQHAVHERLLFDRMMKTYGKQEAAQELLVPIIVSATRQEQAMIEENREMLEGIGLMIEPFSETDVAVRSVPMLLGSAASVSFIRDVLDELGNGRTPGIEKKRAAILQTACKHAVKGGEKLSDDEIRSLVAEMIGSHVTPTCPHGRPLVVALSHTELDRKFKRIQ